ncbi:MAG: glutamate synthase [nadph] large chain precursor, partial [Chloroflexi bacterium]|nr:glutamate synthase [nadph] large chain precursor [Chloroflexota bacterium]
MEHDACGVGFIAQISGEKTHDLVEKAIRSVVNLTHRGAVSADGKSGDGAGLLSQIPRRFFDREIERLRLRMPDDCVLGVGMTFLPRDSVRRDRSISLVEQAVQQHGLGLVGWRQVPVDPNALGDKARATMPDIEQILMSAPRSLGADEAERRLYLIRKTVERAARAEGLDDLYLASCSIRTVAYKGLFVAPQLSQFYLDLNEPDFESSIVVFHQRYSTNTFPTWFLAQPFRMLAHNGEINTLWGNRNWMRAREADLQGDVWGDRVDLLKPIIDETGSDSASLDNALELLVLSGRSPAHAMMMLVPEAWEKMPDMDPDLRAFYEYQALLMEPWDGPAALAFTDGVVAAAASDRNGLRPSRYKVMDDGIVISASEVGVIEMDDAHVIEKGRLAPGEMLLVDTAHKRLYKNADLKQHVASQNTYGQWLRRKLVRLPSVGSPAPPTNGSVHPNGVDGLHLDLLQAQRVFGYTHEDVTQVLDPMGAEGHDAVFSMGDDTPLTVLSAQTRPFYAFFKQRFAQVTNPPIDPLREELVMALSTYAGLRKSVLEESEDQALLLEFPSPILMDEELERIKHLVEPRLQPHVLKCHFLVDETSGSLAAALEKLCGDAVAAVESGKTLLILSDRGVDERRAPIPMLLATSAVHQHLIRAGLRMRADIVVETGDAWDIHHFACLIGYGASAIDPYVALETVRSFAGQREHETLDAQTAMDNFRGAVEAGLLKIMSKMGISALSAYRGAQIFEAIGID